MMHPYLTLALPAAEHTQILAHARSQYPRECCGLLIGRPAAANRQILQVKRSVAAANCAPASDQASSYAIDSLFYLQQEQIAAAAGLEIIGVYHSHPNHPAKPSNTDLRQAWPVYVYLIVSLDAAHTLCVRAWVMDESQGRFLGVPIGAIQE